MSLSLKKDPTLHIYNSVPTTGPDFCQDLIISILKPYDKSCHKHVKNKPKICTRIYRNSEVAYGWLVVGLKVCSHSFSLVTYYSPEVCVTVQEVTPPSLKTGEGGSSYLLPDTFTEAVLQSRKQGDSAARLPRYKAKFYYLLYDLGQAT